MALKDWRKVREIKGELIEWDSLRTNETIKVRMRGGKDNSVSILGGGRTQSEFLAGGNSRRQNVNKTQALKIARAYRKRN